jgi:arginine/lysine/ornithine decarboxylase
MSDSRYLLFYLSPSIEAWQLAELKTSLLWLAGQKKFKKSYVERKPLPATDRTYSYLYALKQKYDWVNIKESVGKMAAENAGITPPCIPVLVAGEIITQQAVDILSAEKKTFGIENGKIKVVRK